MKKITTFLFIGLLAFSPLLVLADDPIIETGDDVVEIINNFAKFLWAIFGGVAVIFFVIAGITFLTAAGDPTKFEKAKKMVFYGVIGVAVALLAGGMQTLIENLLTYEETSSIYEEYLTCDNDDYIINLERV
ncbi:MAG: pilin [Candidatus Pacebacteria bacterium]|nr:pilin [Candidatus Paceibacterota bacterium]